MKAITHRICLAVLLGLLVGHTGIAVHAATHAGDDAVECEFCIAYSDSAATLEASHLPPAPDSGVRELAEVRAQVPETGEGTPYRPRDPPLAD